MINNAFAYNFAKCDLINFAYQLSTSQIVAPSTYICGLHGVICVCVYIKHMLVCVWYLRGHIIRFRHSTAAYTEIAPNYLICWCRCYWCCRWSKSLHAIISFLHCCCRICNLLASFKLLIRSWKLWKQPTGKNKSNNKHKSGSGTAHNELTDVTYTHTHIAMLMTDRNRNRIRWGSEDSVENLCFNNIELLHEFHA